MSIEDQVRKYHEISKQISILNNIKDTLKSDIKTYLTSEKIGFKEFSKYRISVTKYNRTYWLKDKLKEFIMNSGRKVSEFSYDKEIEKLNVVEIDSTELEMVEIS